MRIVYINHLEREKDIARQCLKKKLSSGIKRPVRCITTNEFFGSIREASLKYNIKRNAISDVCRHKCKQAKGLVFEYVFNKGMNNG